MREILFRGKRKDNGEWVEGYLCKKYFRELPHDRYAIMYKTEYDAKRWQPDYMTAEVDPETVGQYTGLTDKNGKKIFEGDIVKDEYSKGQYQYFKVIYNERTYRWETENEYGMLGQLCNVFGECEVIGKIHDNPELLKEGADNG